MLVWAQRKYKSRGPTTNVLLLLGTLPTNGTRALRHQHLLSISYNSRSISRQQHTHLSQSGTHLEASSMAVSPAPSSITRCHDRLIYSQLSLSSNATPIVNLRLRKTSSSSINGSCRLFATWFHLVAAEYSGGQQPIS
ncbi:hypothetical protein Bca4012_091733 [Brassica carinata]